ncbi:MAG: tetratricopeptide repeat protein, partial [Candidatus Limnocylindrales bacterium]
MTSRAPAAPSPRAGGPGTRRGADGPAVRPIDLRLATVHLRTGLLSMSRIELETMAGNGTLDDPALLDLAEVRWRTGDLTGAGEAAEAYLATGEASTLALVIVAEAQAALGRPVEAQRLADRAIGRAGTSLDDIFAGEPRGSIWPADATLVHARIAPRTTADIVAEAAAAGANGNGEGPKGPPRVSAPTGPAELESARVALAAGDETTAAIQLGIVLRVSPALAPAVLDIVGSRPGPSFDLIRGDAYRLVGHEAEAQHAFASASAAVVADPVDEPAVPAAPSGPSASTESSASLEPSAPTADPGEPPTET